MVEDFALRDSTCLFERDISSKKSSCLKMLSKSVVVTAICLGGSLFFWTQCIFTHTALTKNKIMTNAYLSYTLSLTRRKYFSANSVYSQIKQKTTVHCKQYNGKVSITQSRSYSFTSSLKLISGLPDMLKSLSVEALALIPEGR